jgi:5'-methylthioadenosine phosphorylase
LATDYDCWHETKEPVTVEAILATLRQNVALAKRLLRTSVQSAAAADACACQQALRDAIVTDPARIPAALRRKLAVLTDRLSFAKGKR